MAGRAERAYAFSPAPNTSLAPPRICWSLLFRISIDTIIDDRISVCIIINVWPCLDVCMCIHTCVWLILGWFNSKIDNVFYNSFTTISIPKYWKLYRDKLSISLLYHYYYNYSNYWDTLVEKATEYIYIFRTITLVTQLLYISLYLFSVLRKHLNKLFLDVSNLVCKIF